MKKRYFLFYCCSLLFCIHTRAQSCDAITDIRHSSCHPADTALAACVKCNFPNRQGMMASWNNAQVIELVTQDTNAFFRFYLKGSGQNKVGRWLVPEKDVCDDYGCMLSMEQIRDLLQLTYVPTGIVMVKVPPHTHLLEGTIAGSTSATCRQFCIIGDLDEQNYSYYR